MFSQEHIMVLHCLQRTLRLFGRSSRSPSSVLDCLFEHALEIRAQPFIFYQKFPVSRCSTAFCKQRARSRLLSPVRSEDRAQSPDRGAQIALWLQPQRPTRPTLVSGWLVSRRHTSASTSRGTASATRERTQPSPATFERSLTISVAGPARLRSRRASSPTGTR